MNNKTLKRCKEIALITAISSAAGVSASNEQDIHLLELETIIVTATKRDRTLQETPLAVSVTSQQAIEQTQIQDINDLQSLVPSLRVQQLNTSANTNFTIRGFGNGANNAGIEPSVGVFIDGVYRSRAGASIGDLPKLDRVEVLRGPQSTLFGKNASAGVVSIVTAAPSYEPESKIEVGLGNYNARVIKAYHSQGIADNLAFEVSGGINQRDGYIDNLSGGSDLNDKDRWHSRFQALFEPNDRMDFRLIADYSEIEENCCGTTTIIEGPTADAIRLLGGDLVNDSDPFSYESILNHPPTNDIEDGGLSIQADIDFERFSLTSITSYRKNDVVTYADTDFTSLDIIRSNNEFSSDTFTQELRLTSTSSDSLEWMVGAYYFDEKLTADTTVLFGEDLRGYFDTLLYSSLGDLNALFPTGFLNSIESLTGSAPGSFFSSDSSVQERFEQDNTAYSLFATFDYHLTEKLIATAGINYTHDQKKVSVLQRNGDTLSSIDASNTLGVSLPAALPAIYHSVIPTLISTVEGLQFNPRLLDFPNSVEDGESSDSKTTLSLRLAYELNENWNIYASAATGFKASSWNLSNGSRPFPEDQAAIELSGIGQTNQSYGTRYAAPEESTVYELGFKGRFTNASVNIALFDQSIKDFQSSIFVGDGFVLANAGEQSTLGLEVDANYSVTDHLTLTFAGTFLDPKFESFEGASGVGGAAVDLSDTKPAGVHEQSISISSTYDFSLNNGNGYLRLDYLWESPTRANQNTPSDIRREVKSLGASAGFNFDNGIGLQVWGKNLTNEEYYLSSFPGVIQSGTYSGYPNQPRTFGVSLKYEWQ